MSSVNLTHIGAKYNLPSLITATLEQQISLLRPSDVLTTNHVSMKTHLEYDLVQRILIELVNEGKMSLLIAVPCTNPEYTHYTLFYSLADYYRAETDCTCGECEATLDFKNAKVGFKRSADVCK